MKSEPTLEISGRRRCGQGFDISGYE